VARVEDVPCVWWGPVVFWRKGGGVVQEEAGGGCEEGDSGLADVEGEFCVVFEDEGGGVGSG
jgi:hypothetical protein